MNNTIHSERLDLIPLLPSFLSAMLKHDLTEAGRILGLSLPTSWLDYTDVMSLRLKQLEAEPTLQPWLLRGIVLRDARTVVGHIGFHTAPGAHYLRSYCPG